ncbi:MAG: hypothetical protein RSE41_00490 [Clostridia bacterium]
MSYNEDLRDLMYEIIDKVETEVKLKQRITFDNRIIFVSTKDSTCIAEKLIDISINAKGEYVVRTENSSDIPLRKLELLNIAIIADAI